jgi:hypothetical protein
MELLRVAKINAKTTCKYLKAHERPVGINYSANIKLE